MLRWLQGAGMMRRAKEPDEATIVELFDQTVGRLACPRCAQAGLVAANAEDDWGDDAWGMARKCAQCRQPLSPERLEIFPHATLCAACQNATDASDGRGAETPEYCPSCGSLLVLRLVRGGRARYALICPQCGR